MSVRPLRTTAVLLGTSLLYTLPAWAEKPAPPSPETPVVTGKAPKTDDAPGDDSQQSQVMIGSGGIGVGGFAARLIEGWELTFHPDAIHTRVAESAPVLVTTAGEHPEAEHAAKAIREQLVKHRSSLVMDSASLGDTRALSDEALIQKVAALPVEEVVIVRTFDTGQGAEPMAVVTSYNKQGEALWAITAQRNQRMAADSTPPPQAAKKTDSGAVIGKVINEQNDASIQARKAFDEAAIFIVAPSSSYWGLQVFQGKYAVPLLGEDLYNALNRPDLADQLRSNQRRSTASAWLSAIGTLGLIGGGSWSLVYGIMNASIDPDPLIGTPREKRDMTLPLTLTGASVAMLVTAYFVSPGEVHPVQPSDLRRMVDEHNDALRQEHNLPADYHFLSNSGPQHPHQVPLNYDFQLAFSPDGGQLVFQIRY